MYFLNNVIYYTIIYVITNWVGCPAQTSAAKPLVEMSQKSINSNLFVLTGNIPETPEWGISNKYLPFSICPPAPGCFLLLFALLM